MPLIDQFKAEMKSELRDWAILDKSSTSYWQFTVLTLSMCLPRVVNMSPRQQIPERETCDRRFLTCQIRINESTVHGIKSNGITGTVLLLS